MSNARKLADNLPTEGTLSNRNVIINGAMQVAQRGTSSTGLGGGSGYFTVDRFRIAGNASTGRLTMSQSAVTDLAGFANCVKFACTTADTSLGSGDFTSFNCKIEGQDLQRFKKGTSSAEKMTLSFYVKGNAAATYVVEFYDSDNARQISQAFSVTDSWSRVTLVFDGDTTGAFDDDANQSLNINIYLAAGTTFTSGTLSTSWGSVTNANRAVGNTNFYDSTSRTLELTGVQLEVGSQSTPFEHRSFAQEFQLCQRYYARSYVYGTATGASTSLGMVQTDYIENNQGAGYRERYDFKYPVQMRASPTITTYDSAGNSGKGTYYIGASSGNTNKTVNVGNVNATSFGGYSDRATTIGGWAVHYTADAEL